MHCSSCGVNNPEDASFCEGCGAKLDLICPACKASVSPGARFCKKCGTAIGSTKVDSSATSSSPKSQIKIGADGGASEAIEGERKTVTALFADIKGSTELEQDLDPEEARAIVDPALKLMIDAVRRYDGYIVQSTGDGIFALFGAPLAHEDHPQRALYAALRMQEELKRYSARLREAGNLPLEARVGVNTGEVVVRSITTGEGHAEYAPIGHTTNLASRMQALAPTGSIAISEQTRKFVEGYFELKPLGPTRVKGVSEPVNVYEVTGLGALRTRLQRSAGRGYTKFVGREREMDAMKAAAEQAGAGRGQIVAAMAEAGVGKSRLIFEFKATSAAGWMVLEAFSVSHSKASSYLPVIDLLHSYFKIASQDDQRTRREKIAGRIAILDRTLEDTIPYLYSLFGLAEESDPLAQMDPQNRRRCSLDAIKRILLRESLNQPLMVIFEDLHWIDEATQALLNLLADSIGTAKILLLVNYRPEYSHQWNSKTYYTQLRLDPLGKTSADEMLSAMIGDDAGVVPLKRLIIEKTEGNPFFMEETVQVLLDEGALVRNGTVRLTKPLEQLKIPPTVQAILAARIDRLPSDEKDLLQTLAVIGREFAFGLVQRVVPRPEDELNRMLQALQLAEFIYEQPAAGDIEYTFKHALTQEVAYNSVLVERRRQFHRRAAEAIEHKYQGQLEDHYDDLAHHYGRSNRGDMALRYLDLAGRRAENRFALAQAIHYTRSALELIAIALPAGTDRDALEVDLRIRLADSLDRTKGAGDPEIERVVQPGLQLCRRQRGRDLVLLLGQLSSWHFYRGELRQSLLLAEEGIDIANRVGDPDLSADAHVRLATVQYHAGDLKGSLESFERAVSLTDSNRLDDKFVFARTLWLLGSPDQALRRTEDVVRTAREQRDPYLVLPALIFGADVPLFCRLPDRVRSAVTAAELILSQHEIPFPHLLGWMKVLRGWLLSEEGHPEEGLLRVKEGVAQVESAGLRAAMPIFKSVLIGVQANAGLIAEGLKTLDETLLLAQDTGQHYFDAELHRLRGEILLSADGEQENAERCFRDAIGIARRQSAKSWELRATTSLARQLDKQGKRDEARAMLADIYNWFTEGFDTADLKDAKALLLELA